MEQEYSPLSFNPLSTSRDAPNPLRPYYIPPSIGLPPEAVNNSYPGASRTPPSSSSKADFRSSARDIFSDLDYGDYLPERDANGVADMAKRLVDQAIWNYISVLLAQPFEVAKIVLQCHLADGSMPLQPSSSVEENQNVILIAMTRGLKYFDLEDDSDSDAPSYFTPTAPYETPSSPQGRRRRKPPSRSLSATPTPTSHSSTSISQPYSIELRKSDSILEVLSQLWAKEGAWGIWKGTNSTFVYYVLLKTIDTWSTSLLSALLNLPDPSIISVGTSLPTGSTSILDSPNPLASIGVAVAAAGIAGLILAPIDMIRTRLILTPVSSGPRALLPSLSTLPSLFCPTSLLPITLLHSTLPPLLATSAPLLLRSSLHIDPTHTPASSSIATFSLSLLELFVKLPLETILRRGHISVLSNASTKKAMTTLLPMHQENNPFHTPASSVRGERNEKDKFRTLLPVGPYKGICGSIWFIMREEGHQIPVAQKVAASLATPGSRRPAPRKGQGVYGLWRGWRVGFWGLVGIWGASALGGGGEGAF